MSLTSYETEADNKQTLIISITECQGLSQEGILTPDYVVPMKVIH